MTKILHNRIRWLLAMAAVLLTSGGMSAATETVTRLYDSTLLTKTVRTDDGVQYTHLSWLGLDATRTPGAPEMPVEYIRFIVPVYTNNFRVTVTAGGLSRQTLAAPVFPSQEPVLASYEGQVEFTVPNPQYYSATQPIRAEYVEDGFVDGCNHIVTVAVYPASYDDASLSVTTASTVNVTLEYDSCTAAELGSTPIFPPRASKYLDLKSMVVNGERTMNRLYAPREKASPDAPEYYYIITPRNLEEGFQDLAIWKRQKGYNVIVKCIEDVYADPRYRIGAMYSLKDETPQQVVDSAMSLRCYLKDQYQLNGHFFCLLAGDWRTPMPIRKVYWNYGDSINQNSECFIPTDNYYIDLNTDWKLKCSQRLNFYYGDTPQSFSNCISIGRILCSSKKEIDNYFKKLKIYEANPGFGDNTYLGNALFFEQCELKKNENSPSGYVHDRCLLGDSKNIRPLLQSVLNVTLFQDGSHYFLLNSNYNWEPTVPVHSEFEPTTTQILDSMKNCGFFSWHGHGCPYGIYCTYKDQVLYGHSSYIQKYPFWNLPYATNTSLDYLNNGNKPSVVYSTSCETSPFDYLIWGSHSLTLPNMGRQFTTESSEYGGPAALLNTRSSWIGGGSTYEKSFVENILKYYKIGIGEARSKYAVYSTDERCKNNLIGEPEFEMWLGKPKSFSVSIVPSTTGFSISDSSLDSFRLTIFNGIQSKTITTSIGYNQQIDLPGYSEYCISLWKQSYLPVITLYGCNGTLTKEKKYIVRNAILGNPLADNSEMTYRIISGGKLIVDALDNITSHQGFIVENGGEVYLNCSRTINLKGVTVKKGGKLVVDAKNVTFGSDFKVEQGGIFQVLNH